MSKRSERKIENSGSGRKGLYLGIGAAAVVAVGGFFGYRMYQASQQLKAAEITVKKFTDTLKEKDFSELDQLLSVDKDKKNNFSDEEISQKYQLIYDGIGADNVTAKNIKVSKKAAGFEFSYDLSMSTPVGELKALTYKGRVQIEEGKAKLEWAPNLIFPEMSGQDKISVSIDPAIRGEIFDRNQQPLAVNGTLNQLGVVPSQLGEAAEKEQHITEIAEKYQLDKAVIEKALDQEWVQPDYFVPLKIVEDTTGLPQGASIQEVTGRTYPLGEAAAHLIGYIGQVTAEDLEKKPGLTSGSEIGRGGLEAAFDEQLRGKNGGKITITDENGNEKSTLLEDSREDGETIQLTIDREAQRIAFEALQQNPGSTVVTEPKTGELLVLASSPSYDPNKMTRGISQEDYAAYEENTQLPFISRFATGYAPGSTFKVITSAIGLDNGTMKPEDELPIEGLKWQKDASWGDYLVTRVSDVNPVNLRKALVYSDNIYMAQETLKMGEAVFREGLNKFIFGEQLELPIAMNPAQISNEDSFDSEILLADTGYGQGELLLNPIQQATMYSVFANDGTLVYPKLLKESATKTKENVVTAESVALIKEDLKAVVEDASGTAHALNGLGFSLAAKTGTAEIKEKQDEKGQENSFLLALDAESSRYLLISMVENSQNSTSATSLAPPLLQYLNSQNYE